MSVFAPRIYRLHGGCADGEVFTIHEGRYIVVTRPDRGTTIYDTKDGESTEELAPEGAR